MKYWVIRNFVSIAYGIQALNQDLFAFFLFCAMLRYVFSSMLYCVMFIDNYQIEIAPISRSFI